MSSLNVWKIAYILIVTTFGALLFLQKSVDIYWDQTYHKASPFHVDKKELGWIQTSADYSFSQLAKIKQTTQEWNQIMLNQLNQKWFREQIQLAQQKVLPAKSETKPTETQFDRPSTPLNIATELKSAYLTLPQKQQDYFSESIILRPNETVFFAGDSLMQGVAPHAMRILHKSHQVESLDLSKQSTGLSYPKAFDWPAQIEATLSKNEAIKVLVIFLGPNDPWSFRLKDNQPYSKFKSAEWEQEYRDRIRRILSSAQQHFVKVVWLGVPCMKDPKLSRNVAYLSTLYHSEVEKMNQRYLPTTDLLGCQNGFSGTALLDGKKRKIRTRDGIHFEIAGQKKLADAILQQFIFKGI